SHVLLVLSGMLLMALLHYLFFPGSGTAWKVTEKRRAHGYGNSSGKAVPPWGNLEYTPLALDRPDEHFTNVVEHPEKSRWILRRSSEEQMADLLGSLQLNEPAKSFLLDRSHWRRVPSGHEIMPPPEVVISLSPDARHTLYAELAQNPENIPQSMPFTFRTDGFDEWFAECGLAPDKIALVRKLSYTNEDNLCFADANVFREVSTADETLCLLRGLWRVSTFIMKVRIDPDTDVNALIKYWGKGGPAQSYKPLLESMTRIA